MSNVKWIVSDFGKRAHIDRLCDALTKQNIEYVRTSAGSIFNDQEFYPFPDCDPIFYGPMNVCDRLSLMYGEQWYTQETLTCLQYYAAWGKYITNKEYLMMPMAEVFRRRQELYILLGRKMDGISETVVPINDNAIFIRPNTNDKSFSGRLVFQSEFNKFEEHIGLLDMSIHPDTLVIVAKPVIFETEYRCLMNRGKFITGSRYHTRFENGIELDIAPGVPEKVIEFAESIKPYAGLPPLYMLDVAYYGMPKTGYCSIMEVGSVHCAGLYDMDHDLYVKTLTEEAESYIA